MKDDENKEKKGLSDKTMQMIALTALILTVFATFSSLYAGGNTNSSIFSQSKASNAWSYYQAKSLKEEMCHVELEFLELAPPEDADPEKLQQLKKIYQDHIDRYVAEKEQILAEAQQHEADRDKARYLIVGFKMAVVYLQIAILLVSLAGLLKKLYFWYGGIVLGLFGIYHFVTTMMIS